MKKHLHFLVIFVIFGLLTPISHWVEHNPSPNKDIKLLRNNIYSEVGKLVLVDDLYTMLAMPQEDN